MIGISFEGLRARNLRILRRGKHAERSDDVVVVALQFQLPRELFAPRPLVNEFFGEEIGVAIAFRIEPSSRVTIPMPNASDALSGFQQRDLEAQFLQTIELVEAGAPGADDYRVVVTTLMQFT